MDIQKESMPDITSVQKAKLDIPLDWVGMGQVETLLNHEEEGLKVSCLPAKANVYVNLSDPTAKGIHMSRIYLIATQGLENQNLSFQEISELLKTMVLSQDGRSAKARLDLTFELPIKRKALMSDLEGVRHYPVSVSWEFDENQNVCQILDLEAIYSSTCPCSAALARQLIKNKWLSDFANQDSVAIDQVAQWLEKEESIVATPHAQRSKAHVRLKLKAGANVEFLKYINLLEKTLKTPVQTAVKREDEQEFARLNGGHLMFCEDAARALYGALDSQDALEDFWLRVEHLESLHSHNAVSEVSKNGKAF